MDRVQAAENPIYVLRHAALRGVAAPRKFRARRGGDFEVVQGVAAAACVRHVVAPDDAVFLEGVLGRNAVAALAAHALGVAAEDVLGGHLEALRRARVQSVLVRIDHAQVIHRGGSRSESPARAASALVQDHGLSLLGEASRELAPEVHGGGDFIEFHDVLEVVEVKEVRQVVVDVAVALVLRELAEAVLLEEPLQVVHVRVDGRGGSADVHKHGHLAQHAFLLQRGQGVPGILDLPLLSLHLGLGARLLEEADDGLEGATLAIGLAKRVQIQQVALEFHPQAIDDFD
mmetsp:Transcript_141577/g.452653  ORF Transcript_141577/g.452653 Transcript_141577/m.452653 type:complete len:288 (-) Transcript_141577:739-1602(-)